MHTRLQGATSGMLLWLLCGAPLASAAGVDVTIETPEPGAVVWGVDGLAFVAGKAFGHPGPFATFDIVFVIDQSDSTRDSTGADLNGDGRIDGRCAGTPGVLAPLAILARRCPLTRDSVFAAELAAVRALVAQLDPRTTRVGLVTFSGDGDPSTPDAALEAPLGSDYAALESALDRVERRGPLLWTNLQAGLDLATHAFDPDAARGGTRAGAEKIVLLLTDGAPTLPRMGRDPLAPHRHRLVPRTTGNRALAVEAARAARAQGIRIDTYGMGEQAFAAPETAVEIARATGGVFTPVLHPADLQAVFEHVDFSDVDQLEIRNRTNARVADYAFRDADGSFSALLAMREGKNVIEVHARTRDGAELRRQVTVEFRTRDGLPPLEPALVGARNRALRARLEDLRAQRTTLQTQRDEALRRSLTFGLQEESREVEARSRRVGVDVPM